MTASTDARGGPAERDATIDILRALGLLLVMLAHVAPPPTVLELRNFDVVLLVATAGMSFAISGLNRSFPAYVWSRFKRLILPVWLFLTILFLGMMIVPRVRASLDPSIIAASYFMVGGIGYVWIMRVFMTVAVFAPLLANVAARLRHDTAFYAVAVVALLAYCALAWLLVTPHIQAQGEGEGNHGPLSVVMQMLGYSAIFLYGMRLRRSRPLLLVALAAFWSVALIVFQIALANRLLDTQPFKFPPQAAYVAYGLAVTTLLALFVPRIAGHIWRLGSMRRGIEFVAANSVWIYLWHIPVVLAQRATHLFPNWAICYLVAVGFGLVATMIQRTVVGFIAQRLVDRPALAGWMRALLIG